MTPQLPTEWKPEPSAPLTLISCSREAGLQAHIYSAGYTVGSNLGRQLLTQGVRLHRYHYEPSLSIYYVPIYSIPVFKTFL